MATHAILGGEVQLYERPNSRFWWCSASVGGKQRRESTKTDSLSLAKQFAEDWYMTLRGKDRAGLLKSEKTFKQVAEQFTKEYGIITEGQRSPRWVEGHGIRLRLHLLPFFGEMGVSEVSVRARGGNWFAAVGASAPEGGVAARRGRSPNSGRV